MGSSRYPKEIAESAFAPEFAGDVENPDARGADANFACGAFVRFELKIGNGVINSVRYRTNGCGYMIAAAESIARSTHCKSLKTLHALGESQRRLPDFPADRVACRNGALGAIRSALADYRRRMVAEFSGESALVCSCFGVSQETIESCGATSVEDVGRMTNAGTGCGSCQMLIADLIEHAVENSL